MPTKNISKASPVNDEDLSIRQFLREKAASSPFGDWWYEFRRDFFRLIYRRTMQHRSSRYLRNYLVRRGCRRNPAVKRKLTRIDPLLVQCVILPPYRGTRDFSNEWATYAYVTYKEANLRKPIFLRLMQHMDDFEIVDALYGGRFHFRH